MVTVAPAGDLLEIDVMTRNQHGVVVFDGRATAVGRRATNGRS
jgi:hypothetical protein